MSTAKPLPREPESFRQHLSYVENVVARGGPAPEEFESHLAWYDTLNWQIQQGLITEQQRNQLRAAFGAAYTAATLQGYVHKWPLGYPGDFRIIEKIYNFHVSPDPSLRKFDLFFQQQTAPQAVRHRKTYFQQLILEISRRASAPIRVLNLASGPCREIRELLDANPGLCVQFDCIDHDEAALQHAKVVVGRHEAKVQLLHQNVLRYRPQIKYDLIWSAGLFDYFDDRIFSRILERFLNFLTDDGEMVVGNFGADNPTRGYMEAVGKWYLNHRSDDLLRSLAARAGAEDAERIHIGAEPTGVNRFLHIAQFGRTSRVDLPSSQRSKPHIAEDISRNGNRLASSSDADVE